MILNSSRVVSLLSLLPTGCWISISSYSCFHALLSCLVWMQGAETGRKEHPCILRSARHQNRLLDSEITQVEATAHYHIA